MAVHQIKKLIDAFKGLDKRTSDFLDNPEYATEMINADYRDNRTVVKRKGTHYLSQSSGGYGLFTYKIFNSADGSTSDELLTADNNLKKLRIGTITLTNSGTQNVYLDLAVDPTTNTFKMTTDGATSIDIGTGLESSPVSLSSLQSSLSSAGELTMSLSLVSGTEIAAFIEPFNSLKIPGSGSVSIPYHAWVTVDFADSSYNSGAPFTQYFSDRDRDSLENISHAIVNNNMYFANGFDELMKYDGDKIYRAGLPKPAAPTVNEIATPHNVNDTSTNHLGITGPASNKYYYYRYVLQFTDNNGNTITSEPSDHVKLAHSGSNRKLVKVSIPKLQAGQGFHTESTSMKILLYRTKKSIDDSTVAGANFYLLNTQDTNLTATISSTDSTAIVAGDGDLFYAVNFDTTAHTLSLPEILNTNAETTGITANEIIYIDYLEDSDPALSTPYQTTDTLFLEENVEGRHNLPPKGRYLTVHQGCLVIGGRHDFGNEFNYSLPDLNTVTGEIGTEYFPSDDRSLIIESPDGGTIQAIRSLKDILYIFHQNSITYLSGDISITGAPLPKKDVLSKQGLIGATSHHCIEEFNGSLSFLSEDGVYNINNSGGFPQEFSKKIKPLFANKDLKKKRAQSFYERNSQLFLFYVPGEDIHNGISHATSQSTIFCLDTLNGAWFTWEGINFAGGVASFNNETYFMTRQYDAVQDAVVARLSKFKNRDDATDYTDHEKAINFTLITSWDSLGDPIVFKKFIRLKTLIRDSSKAVESGGFTLDLYIRKDFVDYDIGPIVLDAGQLGGWGTAGWGESLYGDRGFEGIRSKLIGKAKSIAFKYENKNINETVLISGLAYEIAAPYKPEIKE